MQGDPRFGTESCEGERWLRVIPLAPRRTRRLSPFNLNPPFWFGWSCFGVSGVVFRVLWVCRVGRCGGWGGFGGRGRGFGFCVSGFGYSSALVQGELCGDVVRVGCSHRWWESL